MNRKYIAALTMAAATLSAGQVFAADASTSKTREQVQTELAEAIRTGEILADAETGRKASEVNPTLYPAKATVQGKTRQEVKADLAEAIRTGDIVADLENGLKANEVNPSLFPAKEKAQGKTREEVKAELAEAIRSGEILLGGEIGSQRRNPLGSQRDSHQL